MRLINKLISYIEDEDVKGLFRFCLILLPFVVAAIAGLIALISYVTAHKEALILIGVAACMIIPAFMGKSTDKPKVEQIQTPPNNNVAFFDRLLTKTLFTIFTTYMGQFQIFAPTRYADLKDDLPSGMDLSKKFPVYRFKVISDGEPIDPASFHELLTFHLEDRLSSGELALGKPVVEFGSQIFPKLLVDECICAGNVWRITILICDNERVAQYITNKRQTLSMRNSLVSLQYEDTDF